MSLSLNRLNERQREAVLHTEGPLLVLAGAGSGKTSTMTYRIAHLISGKRVPASNILGLSFTNKAAGELRERVKDLVKKTSGSKATEGLTVSTFHSLCVKMLRAFAPNLGFQPNFTIVDENDRRDLLRQIFKQVRIDDRKFDLDTILFEIGQAKAKLLKPEQAEAYFLESSRLASDYQIATATAYGHYQRQLRVLNSMDFDDLLYYGVALLEEHPDVRKRVNERFRYILVDEYQDTNATQFRLLELMTQAQQNLCVVGDDDQSIYSWRGADPSHILGFHKRFPAARVITLDQNYRSTGNILEAANGVIVNNRSRHPKSLWSDRGEGSPLTEIIVEDDHGEGTYVAEEIARRHREHQTPYKDFAVLYRSNAQSRIFEEALRREQVPYKIVGGMSFLDRKEVKDTLCYWRLAVNPRDDASLRRIIAWPARGIGKTAIESLGSYAFAQNQAIFDILDKTPEVAPRGAEGAASFHALITELRTDLESATTPELLSLWGKRSLERIGVKKALEEETEEPAQAQKRWESVEELCHSLGQMPVGEFTGGGVAALREFLARMTLESQDDKRDELNEESDQVTLLTLHGAKGLEFPVVFLVGLEDGILPHKRTIEDATAELGEERRLCYVGITRAKDQLFLTRARHRIRYGKPVPRVRSRFMEEIPKDLLVTEDRSNGPTKDDPLDRQKAHEEKVKDYLAGIRGMLTRT